MSHDNLAPVDENRARTVRTIALVVGIVYAVIGVIGFFVTGFGDFASHTNRTLLGFELNPLHNLVHLAIGVAGIVMSRTLRTARTFGWVLAGVFGVVFLYGLVAVGNPSINFLSLNWADNWLHLITALIGLLIALLPTTVRTPGRTTAG
jgi:hypothetical protein